MVNINRRLDELSSDNRTLFGKLDTLNATIASINTTGQLAKQHSTTNEKLFYSFGALALGLISFIAGKIL